MQKRKNARLIWKLFASSFTLSLTEKERGFILGGRNTKNVRVHQLKVVITRLL